MRTLHRRISTAIVWQAILLLPVTAMPNWVCCCSDGSVTKSSGAAVGALSLCSCVEVRNTDEPSAKRCCCGRSEEPGASPTANFSTGLRKRPCVKSVREGPALVSPDTERLFSGRDDSDSFVSVKTPDLARSDESRRLVGDQGSLPQPDLVLTLRHILI